MPARARSDNEQGKMRKNLLGGWRAVFLVCSASMAFAGVAYATTLTSTSGARCTGINGGSLSSRTDGETENNSAATVTAICPLERNTSASTVSGDVFVLDQSTAANVCCHLVSKYPGATRIDGTQVCSTGSSTTRQQLTLPSITDAATFSDFFVQCTVPPINGAAASRIQVYRTTQ